MQRVNLLIFLFQISESLQKALGSDSTSYLAANGTTLSPSIQENNLIEFHSMQYALFITCFIEVLGGIFFLLTAIYIRRDKDDAEQEAACKFL